MANPALDALRRNVSGKVASGEADSIVAIEDAQHYANGYVRPAVMANLPEWALREFLIRHSGPALEAARDEAKYRGWPR
jgi:hypothetical protein